MADNLLDKASILLTPTAYNDGSMLSVKPENGDGDFTFSRSSAATRVNAQGLVENVQTISSELVSNGNFSQIGTEEVSNGNFSQEGSELVTNGDFATDSDWNNSVGNDWQIVNGKLILTTTSPNNINQGIGLVQNKFYKIVFTISNTTLGGVRIRLGTGSFTSTYTDGTHTLYLQQTTTNDAFRFYANSSGVFNGSIDNVSVKEVGQDWILGSGWSIGDGVALNSGGANFSDLTQLNTNITIGKNYKITYTVSDYVSGSFKFIMNSNTTAGLERNADGTYTDYLTSAAPAYSFRTQGSGFNGSITNISVKEVGQDWTFGSGWSIGENKAVHTGAQSLIGQTNILTIGKSYKITFDLSGADNSNYARLLSSQYPNGRNYTSDGTITVYTTTNIDDLYIYGVGNISITNISVKEVTDDTDLPRINYEGFSYQDSLGSELVVNGDFAISGIPSTSTYSLGWYSNTANVSIINNTLILINSASENSSRAYITDGVSSTNVLTTNKSYKLQYEIVANNGVSNLNYIVGNVAYAAPTTIGTHIIYFESGSSVVFQFRNRTTNSNIVFDNVSVKEYLGQEVVPDSGCGSWLLEPQSTNLLPYSENFSQWLTGSATTVSNSAISPSGVLNADKVIASAANTSHSIYVIPSVVSTSTYTFSLYAKADEYERLYIRQGTGSFPTAVVYELTGDGSVLETYGNPQGTSITNVGNSWYRITLKNIASGGNFAPNIMGIPNSGYTASEDSVIFLGDGTSGVQIWGAQLEAQSFSTSYIPTSGAASTRLQDIATNSGNSTLINSTEGVLYAEVSDLTPISNQRISLSDGGNNKIVFNFNSNQVRMLVFNGSVQAERYQNITYNTINKLAISYKLNEFKFAVNGVIVSTVLNGNTPTNMNKLNLSNNVGLSPFYGKAEAVAVYKEALTDSNLRSLTYPNPVATTFDLDFDTIAEQFTFTRGSEATFVNAQGLIESTASNDAPRIDYSTGAKAFLLENQSTNIIPYSEDFSQWIPTRSSVSINNLISPDGTLNATKISETSDNGFHAISIVSNVVSGVSHTVSVFIKKGTNEFVQFLFGTNNVTGNPYVNFDVNQGVFQNNGAISANIQDFGNGWYKCSITVTPAVTSFTFFVSSIQSISSYRVNTFVGNVNNNIYIYGAQLEQQSYATSYIPTSGASATRNQELCNNATPVINSEEGTLYAEMATLADTDSIYRAISVSDGTTSNRAIIRYNLGASDITFLYVKDGVASANIYHIGSEKASDFNKFAFSWKLNEFKVYLNGTQVGVTDTVGNVSNAFTKLSFNDGVANPFFGNTKGLKYYPKALADVQLEDLTQV